MLIVPVVANLIQHQLILVQRLVEVIVLVIVFLYTQTHVLGVKQVFQSFITQKIILELAQILVWKIK